MLIRKNQTHPKSRIQLPTKSTFMREQLHLSFGTTTLLVAVLSFFTSSVQEENSLLIATPKTTTFFENLYLYIYRYKNTYIYRYKKIQQELEHIVQFIPIYRTGYKNQPSVIKMKVPLLE